MFLLITRKQRLASMTSLVTMLFLHLKRSSLLMTKSRVISSSEKFSLWPHIFLEVLIILLMIRIISLSIKWVIFVARIPILVKWTWIPSTGCFLMSASWVIKFLFYKLILSSSSVEALFSRYSTAFACSNRCDLNSISSGYVCNLKQIWKCDYSDSSLVLAK